MAEVLTEIFPDKRTERFDRDDIGTFGKLNLRLEEFHQGNIDILVGTQMLSKGHNFERVNLVVVMGIDGQLNFPDFRAAERAFQTMTQVSGRSGRFKEEGRVLVQTFNPENDIFPVWINRNDFTGKSWKFGNAATVLRFPVKRSFFSPQKTAEPHSRLPEILPIR